METIENAHSELKDEMTDKEVAAAMGLSPKYGYVTVQRWARVRLLRGGNKTGHWLFRREDVEDFKFSRR